MTAPADMNDFNKQVVDEFRANNGVVGGYFEGKNVLLLTTIGAKSGEARLSPLVYTTDGDRYVVAASMGGAPKNPAWYHNLVANPKVTLEVGTEKFEATATVIADRAERDRLYAGMVAHAEGFAEYETKTDRVIPIVVFER
ncbi:deazaflavin-dependent oxidoreductase (nitroreductase family) [Amycolatopsis lexingtonensis]|uniref:Deazaflavin-dependent oxidoreductase (Nitroreductase family) n=1 Tax=Amycolatopsis lexingtonensis TaxID=218822 RepID=A0ABR9IC06_9PSEU|nr:MULTISPECIES: nitroreductase family deazaflavin-dependent oxidoreductase [Amycolatopsis]MBE1500718.1 deazaflavin-dependent oxidoreductase (nitroreductase family) [Amycolatopsis lexingtonensis]NBH06361.1 nitroreductase family deazaflavin-dependent oxidoreductase [Amycolatopsis sp. SID8362]NED43059.1 nitroreductase family deazaflavin-dependent oxidoreductase [Amycolatopsis sp. SID8362]